MKKRIFTSLLALCLLLPCLLLLGSCEKEEKYNSLDYLEFTLLENDTYAVSLKDEYHTAHRPGSDSYIVGEKMEELNRKTIKVPETYEGKPVTEVKDSGFIDSHAESVILPSTITYIGKNAFYGNLFLESVEIPESVKTIGDQAFDISYGRLSSIVLPASVEYLGTHVFAAGMPIYYKGTADQFASIKCVGFSVIEPNVFNVTYTDTPYVSESDRNWYCFVEDLSGVDVLDYVDEARTFSGVWSYGSKKSQIESIAITYGESVSGKTYAYSSSDVTLTDEYWQMLKQAESAGMLESVLGAEELALYNASQSKEAYAEKLEEYNATALAGMTVVFADGKVTMYQNGEQYTQPFDYIEINNTVYYKLRGTWNVLFTIDGNAIVEDSSTELGGAKHTYLPQ